jgi:hypothetical protein
VFTDFVVLAGGRWERERWWYKLAQVCRRWRHLILASPSYLGLSLLCMPGTPVADMLAHSPPFPLTIDHLLTNTDDGIATEDEEGILLALERRDRVRRIRLRMPVLTLKRLIKAIDEEFPMLEYLYLYTTPQTVLDPGLSLPLTLRAPRLRHLVVFNFPVPTGSPLLSGLVTLSLEHIPLSSNFSLTELLQRLSLMPELEILRISFYSPHPDQDIEGQLLHTSLPTQITLPNLRWFGFGDPITTMEAVLPLINMPLLEVTELMSFNYRTFSILFILQLMCKTEKPRFKSVRVTFSDRYIVVTMYPCEQGGTRTLRIHIFRVHPDWAVAATVQITHGIRAAFSEVDSLILENETSLEWHEELADRTQWRTFLGSFSNVRTLHVSGGRIEELVRALQPDDGETPIELLPELTVLSYSMSSYVGESCRSFLDIRRNAGRPVTLAHC